MKMFSALQEMMNQMESRLGQQMSDLKSEIMVLKEERQKMSFENFVNNQGSEEIDGQKIEQSNSHFVNNFEDDVKDLFPDDQ